MEFARAPLDGSLPTLPDIADFYAKHIPNKPWLVFPSKDASHELTTISFAQMAQASHRVAHILRPGRQGPECEVVAMLLNTDTLLYAAAALGLLRAGFVVSSIIQSDFAELYSNIFRSRILCHLATQFKAFVTC